MNLKRLLFFVNQILLTMSHTFVIETPLSAEERRLMDDLNDYFSISVNEVRPDIVPGHARYDYTVPGLGRDRDPANVNILDPIIYNLNRNPFQAEIDFRGHMERVRLDHGLERPQWDQTYPPFTNEDMEQNQIPSHQYLSKAAKQFPKKFLDKTIPIALHKGMARPHYTPPANPKSQNQIANEFQFVNQSIQQLRSRGLDVADDDAITKLLINELQPGNLRGFDDPMLQKDILYKADRRELGLYALLNRLGHYADDLPEFMGSLARFNIDQLSSNDGESFLYENDNDDKIKRANMIADQNRRDKDFSDIGYAMYQQYDRDQMTEHLFNDKKARFSSNQREELRKRTMDNLADPNFDLVWDYRTDWNMPTQKYTDRSARMAFRRYRIIKKNRVRFQDIRSSLFFSPKNKLLELTKLKEEEDEAMINWQRINSLPLQMEVFED